MRIAIAGIVVGALVAMLTVTAGAQYPPPPPPTSPPPAQPTVSAAVRSQANVAAQHAKFAAGGQTLAAVSGHLRHVLMCIEGPKGNNVTSSWENPCRGLGNGVLVDLQKASNPSLLNTARTADSAAVAGLRSNSLARMKAAAKEVAALMTRIAQAK